ncbi:MAG TPA: ABC transporter permease, partial [Flavitalea sp.]|nr:ABC transporter permease [Flavitalea sp.]
MIGNVLRSCIRFIRFNKLFVTLNIIGLSIGISACWITYRIVEYEFSIDKNYPDADRIFQLVTLIKSNGSENGMGGVSTAALPVLQKEVSGVEMAVPIYQNSYNSLKIASGNEIRFRKDENLEYCNTLPSYFDMIPYMWLAGDKQTALSGREKTVITEKRAKEYFPQLTAEEVIGKTLTYNDSIHKVVSGVVANLQLSSFSMDEFHLLPEEEVDADNWSTIISYNMLFLKLQAGVHIDQVVKQVNRIYEDRNREEFEKHHYHNFISQVPIEEMHFRTDYASPIRKANRNVVAGLAAVAIFILLLACINYVNISTAQLPQRAKEIGIRKTMGSSFNHLIWRFVAETLMITSIAAILSILLSRWGFYELSDFMPEGMMDYLNYPRMISFAFILIILISLLSGIYPALLSSRVNAVEVLKGQTIKSIGRYSISLRKALIVFQFFIAQVFIVAAFIVGQQMHFMLTKDLGFDKEAVLTIDVPYHIAMDSLHRNRKDILLQKLRQNPAILNASLGDRSMDNNNSATGVYSKSNLGITKGQLNLKFADSGYVGVYKFRLLSGRNISASDTLKEYLINEAAVKEFGFSTPENAVGKILYNDYAGTAFPIVGVVQDYHQF